MSRRWNIEGWLLTALFLLLAAWWTLLGWRFVGGALCGFAAMPPIHMHTMNRLP